MFMKKIFIETITIFLIVGTLPVVICQNQCTEYGDQPRNSTFSPDALVSVVDLCVNLTDVLSGLSEVLPLGQLMQFNDSNGEERAANRALQKDDYCGPHDPENLEGLSSP